MCAHSWGRNVTKPWSGPSGWTQPGGTNEWDGDLDFRPMVPNVSSPCGFRARMSNEKLRNNNCVCMFVFESGRERPHKLTHNTNSHIPKHTTHTHSTHKIPRSNTALISNRPRTFRMHTQHITLATNTTQTTQTTQTHNSHTQHTHTTSMVVIGDLCHI